MLGERMPIDDFWVKKDWNQLYRWDLPGCSAGISSFCYFLRIIILAIKCMCQGSFHRLMNSFIVICSSYNSHLCLKCGLSAGQAYLVLHGGQGSNSSPLGHRNFNVIETLISCLGLFHSKV